MRLQNLFPISRISLCVFSVLLSFSPLFGQNFKPAENFYKAHVTILPNVSYSPETRLVLGGVLMYQFKPSHSSGNTRSSNLILNATYTLNRQLMIEAYPFVFLPGEKWILSGSYYYHFYPQNYWGIGSDTRPDDKWNIEYKQWWFRQAILKQVGSHLFAGPQFRVSKTYQMEIKSTGDQPRPRPTLPGILPTMTSGVGFVIRWDNRNSLMTPMHNELVEFSAMWYPGWLGSTYPFSSWNLDLRKYIPLGPHNSPVLAMNMIVSLTTGNPPFLETAALGGSEIMRGYYKGRFRDHDAAQVQLAFRQHLIGRFGLCTFAAAGQVWPNVRTIGLNNLKWSAGAGLRFNLNPDDQANLRFDFGFGRHVMGYYLTLGEAF